MDRLILYIYIIIYIHIYTIPDIPIYPIYPNLSPFFLVKSPTSTFSAADDLPIGPYPGPVLFGQAAARCFGVNGGYYGLI